MVGVDLGDHHGGQLGLSAEAVETRAHLVEREPAEVGEVGQGTELGVHHVDVEVQHDVVGSVGEPGRAATSGVPLPRRWVTPVVSRIPEPLR